MDGLPQLYVTGQIAPDQADLGLQRTLRSAICCVGTGLHSGRPVRVALRPAAGTGIVFHRTDLGVSIPATHDHVTDTRLCTVLSRGDARVGTIEHLMAAFAACGITDATVDVDGPELPVLDGSSSPWVFLIDCAATVALDAPARTVVVRRTVRVTEGDAWAELRPNSSHGGLDLSLSIEFTATAIGRQALTLTLSEAMFRAQLAECRTFVLVDDIAALQSVGLAAGGSLDNAIVVDGARVLNPAGLKCPDEFVRHKMLDAIGDLALTGAALNARFTGHKSGHALNNRVLRALFADAANWAWADAPASVRHRVAA